MIPWLGQWPWWIIWRLGPILPLTNLRTSRWRNGWTRQVRMLFCWRNPGCWGSLWRRRVSFFERFWWMICKFIRLMRRPLSCFPWIVTARACIISLRTDQEFIQMQEGRSFFPRKLGRDSWIHQKWNRSFLVWYQLVSWRFSNPHRNRVMNSFCRLWFGKLRCCSSMTRIYSR